MKRVKLENININEVISILENDGLIIFPTETAYGAGVNALSQNAVDKLLKYKQRPPGKPISIGVSNLEQASKYVDLNKNAKNIYKNFLPGPVTVISKSRNIVCKGIESEAGTLGVRIPAFNFLLELFKKYNKPVTMTSANLSGKKTPYSVEDILENLSQKQIELIDLIIDGGELPKNPTSTVIDTTKEELVIYRSGQIDPRKVIKTISFNSNSVEATLEIGKKIFELIDEEFSKLILLNGELGAGKTHLTKGIALFLGVNQVIKSPTYNYISEYKIQPSAINHQLLDKLSNNNSAEVKTDNGKRIAANGNKLYHIDAWRIEHKEDLEALQIKGIVDSENFVVIEWPTVITNLVPEFFNNKRYTFIEIINSGENSRIFRIHLVDETLT